MAQEAIYPIFDASLSSTPTGAQSTLSTDSRTRKIVSRVILGTSVVVLVSAVGLGLLRQSHSGEIYPGVEVAGISLGGYTQDEATVALEEQAATIERSRAHFDYASQRWAPTMQELGVSVDVENTVAQAYAFGREGTAPNQFSSAIESASGSTTIPLITSIDSTVLEQYLDQIDQDLGLVPNDAELVVEGASVSVIPEANGTVTDRQRMQELLLTSLEQMSVPSAALPVVDQFPSVYATDLEPARIAVEGALAKPVDVVLEGEKWTIQPADLGQFILTVPGSNGLTATLDQEPLTEWLSANFAADVNQDPIDATVAWDGERVIATSNSQTGLRMRPALFAESVTASFLGDHLAVDIPVSVLEPKVNENNLDALGIKTRMAAGTSNFAGSEAGRATNIYVGSALLNGVLIPPGETFSFNHSIGVIDADLGFVESQVVDGERIGRDIGGGICQVSTTVYRATLYAGLPITEWHPHRYRLGFYELEGWTVGLDASILQPEGNPFGGGDFQFVNNTDSWILMESYVDGETVAIVLYGPDLNYDVVISEPTLGEPIPATEDIEVIDDKLPAGSVEQGEWAQEGLDVSYLRSVYDGDGNLILEDTWDTHFYPRGNVYKVSPDMVGQSPAAGNNDSE